MKKTTWKLLLGIFAIALLCIIKAPNAEAASYVGSHSSYNNTVKVGKIKVTSTNYDYDKGYCTLVVKKNNKKILTLKQVRPEFVTNGSLLYYSKVTKPYPQTEYTDLNATCTTKLYRYSFSSKKQKLIMKGQGLVPLYCSGKYLHYAKTTYLGDYKVYARNLKTNKSKYMAQGIDRVMPCGDRIICTSFATDVSNNSVYSFKTNGTGKKKIATGFSVKVKKGYVYYSRVYYDYDNWEGPEQFRDFKVLPNGTKRKVVKDWYTLW